jgi:DNA-binding beta-propeller fold protein YncE
LRVRNAQHKADSSSKKALDGKAHLGSLGMTNAIYEARGDYMKAYGAGRIAVGALLVALIGLPALMVAAEKYHLVNTYKFGPAEGATREYFDYIAVDAAARRVYVSHGTEIIVLDADSGAVAGKITGLKQDHGVAVASEFGRGFISDGGAAKAIIFDLKTLKVTGEAKADKDADSILYDPASKRVFVMNGDPHSSTVIDAKSGSVVGSVELGGQPEFAVADGKGTVFVNLEDKSEVVAVDSNTLKVKSRWPVAPAGGPTALAMDIEHHRLFSAGREPAKLAVIDADSGKVVASFTISGGADAAAYEPETGLIFVSTREGFVHVFHEDAADKYSEAETIKTEFGAKTMGLDTKTHKLFLSTVEFGPAPAATTQNAHPRPTAVPGTFHVLVYGQ